MWVDFQKQNRDRGVVTFQTEEAKRAAVELLNKLTRPDSDLPYIISDAEFIVWRQLPISFPVCMHN